MIPAVVQMGNAFGDRPAVTAPANLQGKGVLRVRPVTLTPALFDDAGARNFAARQNAKKGASIQLHMNFFPDVRIDVDWTHVDKVQNPAGLSWSGKVVGPSPAPATLVVSGNSVTANVPGVGGKAYQVRTTPDGAVWVREVDQKNLPN
jgi:hypothetical protein